MRVQFLAWVVLMHAAGTPTGGLEPDAAGWVRLASFSAGEHRELADTELAGVARFMCKGGAWESQWAAVLEKYTDRWESVTLMLRQKSPLAAPSDKDLKVTWRQPASADPCVRGQEQGEAVQLLDVRLWDGHGSVVLTAVDNHWPFSTAFNILASSGHGYPQTGAELLVCPGIILPPSPCRKGTAGDPAGERGIEKGGAECQTLVPRP